MALHVVPPRSPVRAALVRDAAAIVVLLERFGDLLTEALEAARHGADEEFAVAVAERTRITTALGNRLASLAITRQLARRDGATVAEIAAALRPVDVALRHALLLHDGADRDVAGEAERAVAMHLPQRRTLALVR